MEIKMAVIANIGLLKVIQGHPILNSAFSVDSTKQKKLLQSLIFEQEFWTFFFANVIDYEQISVETYHSSCTKILSLVCDGIIFRNKKIVSSLRYDFARFKTH